MKREMSDIKKAGARTARGFPKKDTAWRGEQVKTPNHKGTIRRFRPKRRAEEK